MTETLNLTNVGLYCLPSWTLNNQSKREDLMTSYNCKCWWIILRYTCMSFMTSSGGNKSEAGIFSIWIEAKQLFFGNKRRPGEQLKQAHCLQLEWRVAFRKCYMQIGRSTSDPSGHTDPCLIVSESGHSQSVITSECNQPSASLSYRPEERTSRLDSGRHHGSQTGNWIRSA